MRPITKAILHCSATPDYPENDSKYDLFGAVDIDAWHKKRGWQGIGYHYVIRRTGQLEHGRNISEIGAHVKGHNTGSVGVCYIGSRTPTDEQVAAMLTLARNLNSLYGIGADDWTGHYEYDTKKTCPGFPMQIFREMVRYYLKS